MLIEKFGVVVLLHRSKWWHLVQTIISSYRKWVGGWTWCGYAFDLSISTAGQPTWLNMKGISSSSAVQQLWTRSWAAIKEWRGLRFCLMEKVLGFSLSFFQPLNIRLCWTIITLHLVYTMLYNFLTIKALIYFATQLL